MTNEEHRHRRKLYSLFYHEENGSRNSLKRSRGKKIGRKKKQKKYDVKRDNLKYLQTAEIIIIKNLIFWTLKLTAKAVKISLNFTRVRVIKIVAEDLTLN